MGKDKATKSKKVTKRATTKYGGIKTWPISACCTWCNQGSWQKAKNQAACQARASANGATHYTWKPASKNCRIDKNSKGCKAHGSGYGKRCDGNVHTKPGYAKKKIGTCKDKATKSKKVTKRATTKYGGIKTWP